MSLYLASENGYVADIATATGWDDLSTEVSSKLFGGALIDFINNGTTENPQEVTMDIVKVLPSIKNVEVKNTLQGLKTALEKCKEIAILSQ